MVVKIKIWSCEDYKSIANEIEKVMKSNKLSLDEVMQNIRDFTNKGFKIIHVSLLKK
jgi:hypothetical protein